jgi:hypothetical protein
MIKRLLLLFLLVGACIQPSQAALLNGLMIDSARLLERHEYYYKLVDFMSEWGMNTLLFHFSDDHGLSLKIPGYEKLARAHAFTPQEMKDLISYAASKDIDIIPELEVFGHTRYITDHPDYRHLFLGDPDAKITFNALNPLMPETLDLMRDMITKVSDIFPSSYFHLGCDEVNLSALHLPDDSTEAIVWSDYVNKMISFTVQLGKQPMIWDDHLKKSDIIADMIDKNAILVDWNYDPDYQPAAILKLKDRGFSIIMAPSISCWRNRMIPSKPQLRNVDIHADQVQKGTASGMINTVWLPMRYLQDAMWYGMAYGAYRVDKGKPDNLKKFNRVFVKKTFNMTPNPKMLSFLDQWTSLVLHRKYFSALANENFEILNDPANVKELEDMRTLSGSLIKTGSDLSVKNNQEIFDAMYLSAQIIYTLSEGLLILSDEENIPVLRKNACLAHLDNVIARAELDWDRGRFPDDPAKFRAKFPNQASSHLLIVLRKLKKSLIL